MKKSLQLFILIILMLSTNSCDLAAKRDKKVLVFSKTAGYRHDSIEPGVQAIMALGQKHGFQVDTTENAALFTEENLKQYSAVIFFNTTGDVLDYYQQADFQRYIQAGGGFVGIHAAADTEYHWMWYGKLVGGYFNGHPNNPNVREAKIQVLDKNHEATQALGDEWQRADEWYNYKSLNPATKVLMNLDETSYEGGTNGENHPIAWYHDYDGGRAFYTGLGHTKESFIEEAYLTHILGGINYAIGQNKPLDYSKATTYRLPEENRFTKVVLESNLNEPLEMTILSDGKILFVERRGQLKLHDPELDTTKVIANIQVHTKFEDGLLGLALDPDYDNNHWIYLYYSPAGDEPVQHLSRFELNGEDLDMDSEIVMLKVPVQRDECCHTGGSIEFGPDGNLFLSTGDDTNPFKIQGYAPIDERRKKKPWDAQRSSGNTNDLRGKILRIHPEPDGTYTIPDGNLFPKDDSLSKPEIYVMGCRNPYRISIDQKTGYLYWGDVGPDAGEEHKKRGPRGHDEINQARAAGFFGWPYFVGNNKAYRDYDFSTKKSGDYFDPDKPINSSVNNTGRTELPPAQPAFIWYPYAESPEFPIVGEGGRNAMAGPVVHRENFAGLKNKFPDYFDKKMFIYDWIRDWILIVTMDENGDLANLDPFMPNTDFSNIMDFEFGPDGSLYGVEYGEKWFSRNQDATLFRIDYNGGNRPPVVKIAADKTVGAAPLTVNFSAEVTDYDGDQVTYNWEFMEKGGTPVAEESPAFTFPAPGTYKATLTVTDTEGNQGVDQLEIRVGNDKPNLGIALEGNQTFYFDKRKVTYDVTVDDSEDGSTKDGSISAEDVYLTIDYLDQGFDKTLIEQGHQENDGFSKFIVGKRLMEGSDCKACHQKEEKSIGPSYLQVAEKYNENDLDYLADKIIKGGGGVWGEQAMAAHPQLSKEDAEQIATYILSINDEKNTGAGLPLAGDFTFNEHLKTPLKGTYFIKASYTDKGGSKIGPLSAGETLVLRSPDIPAKNFDGNSESMVVEIPGTKTEVVVFFHESYIHFDNIDLTSVKSITLMAGKNDDVVGGEIEVRADGPDGKLIGKAEVMENKPLFPVVIDLGEANAGIHNLYFVGKNDQSNGVPLFGVVNIIFDL